jgi:arylsulfatase A-like enzyme
MPAAPPTAPEAQPVPGPTLYDFQISDNGVGFDHDLLLRPDKYFENIYISPIPDDLVAELALAFLGDTGLALGRRGAPDRLAVSFSAQDVVSHSYGNESEEDLDVLRRLDLHLGRLLEALGKIGPRGTVALGLSSDHGFFVIPEAGKKRVPGFTGGRLVEGERIMTSFSARLDRLVAEELCVGTSPGPLFGVEGWDLKYNRPSLPLHTVTDRCGPVGTAVSAASIDAVLPAVVDRFYKEEIREVLLTSAHDRWPADDPAVPFALNDFDAERSGDALLIPNEGVLMHWDPGRGSGHGSHYDYDTHVPLIFWGGGFPAEWSADDTSPYDLAPTLADSVGVGLPDAVGRSRLPGRR